MKSIKRTNLTIVSQTLRLLTCSIKVSLGGRVDLLLERDELESEPTTQYINQESKPLASLIWYICFLHGWSGQKSSFILHVALPKRSINQFITGSAYQTRAYCPNVYTVTCGDHRVFFLRNSFNFSHLQRIVIGTETRISESGLENKIK